MTTIELTTPEELKAAQKVVAATDLVTCGLMQRFLKCKDDEAGTIGRMLGRAHQLQLEMQAYMEAGNKLRVAELEEELAAVVAEGLQAERALEKAINGVMEARQTDAALENWHNRASVALKTAKEQPLPRFYTPADEQRKAQAIAVANAELEKCLDEMANHPMLIPLAIQRQQQAQAVVGKLAAKAKALRSELQALGAAKPQSTGTPDNGTGLGTAI